MHRFFLSHEDFFSESEIRILSEDTVKHMTKVLRVKPNESIEIVHDGVVYVSEVRAIDAQSVTASVVAKAEAISEAYVRIDLFQCLPKGQKLEWILQKNVEVGVDAFYLVASERCVVDWGKKDTAKKLERYEKIIKEAAKQSKRLKIPKIEGLIDVKQLASYVAQYDLFLVFYENEKNVSIKTAVDAFEGKKIALFVGPEGGLTSQEIELLSAFGAKIVTLGKRILRTETAGLFAAVCCQYAFEL